MRALSVVLCFVVAASGRADTPRMPIPFVTPSASGRCLFAMLPGKWNGKVAPEPFGIAYELRDDGSLHELWRLKGIYCFRCFISDDGRYLVSVSDWPSGSGVSKEDVALIFYDRGKQLRRFSTADLVKDGTKVRPSVSHYEWFFQPKGILDGFTGPEAPQYMPGNTFSLTTVDGIAYTFDATRGEITNTRDIPPEQMKSLSDF